MQCLSKYQKQTDPQVNHTVKYKHGSKKRPRSGQRGFASRSLLLPYQQVSSGACEYHYMHNEHLTNCITNTLFSTKTTVAPANYDQDTHCMLFIHLYYLLSKQNEWESRENVILIVGHWFSDMLSSETNVRWQDNTLCHFDWWPCLQALPFRAQLLQCCAG